MDNTSKVIRIKKAV